MSPRLVSAASCIPSAALAAALLTACAQPVPEAPLPESVLAGDVLTGEAADATFTEWLDVVALDPRMPLHVDYAVEVHVVIGAEGMPDDVDGLGEFGVTFRSTLTMLDDRRMRYEVAGEARVDGEPTLLDFDGTLISDGETVWGWGEATMDEAGVGDVEPVTGSFRLDQTVLDEAASELWDFFPELMAETDPGMGELYADVPFEKYPESFLAMLHPTTYLWLSAGYLECDDLRLDGDRLRAVLGLRDGDSGIEAAFRSAVEEAEGDLSPEQRAEFERILADVLAARVEAWFDAETGVLVETGFDGEFSFEDPDTGGTMTFDVQVAMEATDLSYVLEEDEEEILRPPDALEPMDVTGFVQMGMNMLRQTYQTDGGDADVDF